MDYRRIIVILILITISSTGCIFGSKKEEPPPKVYVNPCVTTYKGVQVRVDGGILHENYLKHPISVVLVDDFESPSAKALYDQFYLICWWGANIGENRDYYYCWGRYVAPQMDDGRVIKQWVWKEFKLGFDVEEHHVGEWTDPLGRVHPEQKVNYLTIKEIWAQCYLS